MKKYLLVLLVFISIISCKKDDDVLNPTPTSQPEPQQVTDAEFALDNFGDAITSNFIGRIVDENGASIKDVTVRVGNSFTTTDHLGVFVINNASVNENFAFIKAEKEGYVLGSRTIIPTPNGTNDIQITLLEKNTIGSVNSGVIASVSLPNGSEVEFQGEFITATGQTYSGQVDVVMHYLQPNNPDTFLQMPGNLFGKREDGSAVAMETYGMLSVNLFSPAGEQININPDFPATLTFPVDASTPNAPTEIALWYFDESVGYWKEQGVATKVGNQYIAEVTHFTWWNCDLPLEYVNVCFTVNGSITLSNHKIEIIRNETNQIIFSGYTNEVGEECGLFPKDEALTVSIYGNSECSNEVVHTQLVGPFSADNSFTINISNLPSELIETIITGTLNNCDNNPITNGYALIYNEANTNLSNSEIIAITNGILNHTITYCSSSAYKMIVFDASNDERSDVIDLTLTPTSTAISVVSTCEALGGTFVGDVILTSQEQVNTFGLFGYSEIQGSLGISGVNNLNSLSSLVSIDNVLAINNNALTSLSGLENLNYLGGDLTISNNAVLTSISALINTSSMGDSITITNNNSIVSLLGINNIVTNNINVLRIEGNENLLNLSGLENVSYIESSLFIENNDSLTSLVGLENVLYANFVNINNNTSLSTLTELINLTSVEVLLIKNNAILTSLSGLDNLNSIVDDLTISNNNQLTSITELSGITSLDAYLTISENPVLTSLSGLNNLTSVNGFLTIVNNNTLSDLSGLNGLEFISGNLIITDNLNLGSLNGLENLSNVNNIYIGTNVSSANLSNINLNDYCALTDLVTNGTYSTVNIANNAYNPTAQDIIDGNCSQ